MQAIACTTAPLVTVSHNRAITTSLVVAQHFNKNHRDVLRAIENVCADLPPEHARNFALMSLNVEIGNGATRKSPAYEITRDGFTLLAMGFTGKRALQFKLAYIDAFNKMEEALRKSAGPARRSHPLAPPAETFDTQGLRKRLQQIATVVFPGDTKKFVQFATERIFSSLDTASWEAWTSYDFFWASQFIDGLRDKAVLLKTEQDDLNARYWLWLLQPGCDALPPQGSHRPLIRAELYFPR